MVILVILLIPRIWTRARVCPCLVHSAPMIMEQEHKCDWTRRRLPLARTANIPFQLNCRPHSRVFRSIPSDSVVQFSSLRNLSLTPEAGAARGDVFRLLLCCNDSHATSPPPFSHAWTRAAKSGAVLPLMITSLLPETPPPSFTFGLCSVFLNFRSQ